MRLFKNISLSWWQVSIFKLTVLAFGVAAGAYWSDLFLPFLTPLIAIFIAGTVYLLFVWWKE